MSDNPGFEHPLSRFLRRESERFEAQQAAQRESQGEEPEEEPTITSSSISTLPGNSLGSVDIGDRLVLIFNHGHWVAIQRRHWTLIVSNLDSHERREYMEY